MLFGDLHRFPTYMIVHGSFRPFTRHSILCFFLSALPYVVFTWHLLAWVFLIPQYGLSVSIIIRSTGTTFRASRFSSVFREHPLIPNTCLNNQQGLSLKDIPFIFRKQHFHYVKLQALLSTYPRIQRNSLCCQ